jgi:tetratricopeptide (TPR) repeat protein
MLLAGTCVVGAWYSAILARAEWLFRQSSPSSVDAAVRLIPYNPRYLVGLASLRPEHAPALLRRALTLNEYDVRSWVQLGLEAEFQRQDLAAAESCYRRAADASHMFYARSNLANFYYRYQRYPEFLHWVPLALQRAYSDPSLLFLQIWGASGDGRFNLSLMPNRAAVLNPYVSFLLQTNRLDEVEPALTRSLQQMAIEGTRADTSTPMPYAQDPGTREFCGYALDRLLLAGRWDSAQRVWTQLYKRGWLAEPAPSAASPLTNGGFRSPCFRHGFDWAFTPTAGATIDQYTESSKLRITFDGKEPEAWQLLHQFVILEPNGRYRLSWDAESESIPKNSGLQWRLVPVSDQGPAAVSDLVSSDLLGQVGSGDTERGAWDFTAPPEPLDLLVLEYIRRFGTVRPEGDLSLRSVELKRLPQ